MSLLLPELLCPAGDEAALRAALDHVVFVGDVSRTGQIADALREANDKAYVF